MRETIIIKYSICIIALAILGLFGMALYGHYSRFSSIRFLPDVQAVTIDGEIFDLKQEIDSSKRTAILYFNPDCEFCQQEIKGIVSRYSECRNVQWVFYTLAQLAEVIPFANEYQISNVPDSYIILEEWPRLYKELNIKAPPELFIYDEHGEIMVHHKGATSINTIVEELQ